MNREDIERSVERYYAEKIRKFGAVPAGVDWNSVEAQEIRFDQLVRILRPGESSTTLLDYGCGYGALADYLELRKMNVRYIGFDISRDMISEAERIHPGRNYRWIDSAAALSPCDYVIASGVFNVRGDVPDADWAVYVKETLRRMNELAIRGFAFNILTSYSDSDKRKSYLYYASPSELFDYCRSRFSRSVALLHDYPLYEFTILVRKDVL